MALPSSGAISINDIVLMFGGAAPHGLGEYYKNGTYVFNTDTVPNVPTSGSISLDDFYGAEIVESYVSTVTAGTSSQIEYNASQSTAKIVVQSTGEIVGNGTLIGFTKYWITGTPRSSYQVRFTKMSDTTSGTGSSSLTGTFDAWLGFNATLELDAIADNAVNFSRTITVKVEVRRTVDQVVVSTTGANVLTLKAESNVGSPP